MVALAGVRQRLIPLLDRYGDAVLAGCMSAAGVAEAVSEGATFSENRIPVLVLLATLPIAWRRRWPLAAMLGVFLGAVISREAPYTEIACVAIAAYSVGAHERRVPLALVVLVTMGVAVVAIFGGRLPPLPDFLSPFLILLPLWLIGIAIREARMRAEASAERARRLEQEQQLAAKAAQAEERARIARELHDVVAHSVSVMVVQAGAARQVVEQTPDRASAALRAVEDTGREAMQELRRILGVLGSGDADRGPQPGLDQVGALVDTVRRAGLPVRLDGRGAQRPVSAILGLTVYRLIQEALTNAVKHSGLAPTVVVIDFRPGELKLEVLCDGPVAASVNGTPGRGLAGMQERVAALGGRIEAGPGVAGGYHVRAWLPLDGPA